MNASIIRWMPGLLGALLCPQLTGAARAEEYRSARVSDLRGDLTVRADGEEPTYLERNGIVREGDTLWTDENGQAELELDRGAWLRLAEDTKVEVQRLPPDGELRLWTGSVYLDVPEDFGGATRICTPVGDVDVLPDSVVRVDLDKGESARVSVFSGRAEVLPEHGEAVRLNGGERGYLEDERDAGQPERFDRQDQDGFDRYQKDRVDYFIGRPLPRELDRDIIGARELSDYGTWVTVDETRYWRPRCEPEWRPYSNGYWSYVPSFGYSWVDYAPWGYTTCHYGRWLYRPTHGWLWAPGYAWAPAYVSWASYGDYCGWAPLDPWDRPCAFERGFGFGLATGLFVDFTSWSFCPRNDFFHSRHHRNFWNGPRYFYRGNDIHARSDGFRVVGDAHREFGVPRDHGRGISVGRNGRSVRDSILRVENRLPERRLQLIQKRFNEPGRRDRDVAIHTNPLEHLQRDRGARVDDSQLLKGPQAPAIFRRVGPRGGDNNANGNNGADNRRYNRDDRTGANRNPFDRNGSGVDRNRADQNGATGDRNRTDRNGTFRDNPFRRGGNNGDNGGRNDRDSGGRYTRGGDGNKSTGGYNRGGDGSKNSGSGYNRGGDGNKGNDRGGDSNKNNGSNDRDRGNNKDRRSQLSPGFPDRVRASTGDGIADRARGGDRDGGFRRGTLLPGYGRGSDGPGPDTVRSPLRDRTPGGVPAPTAGDSINRDRGYRRSVPDNRPAYRDFAAPPVTPRVQPTPPTGGDRDSGYRRDSGSTFRRDAPDTTRSAPSYGGPRYNGGNGGGTYNPPSSGPGRYSPPSTPPSSTYSGPRGGGGGGGYNPPARNYNRGGDSRGDNRGSSNGSRSSGSGYRGGR